MKEIIGIAGNIKGGWKSTLIGGVFVGIFIYQYFTMEKIELVSIDSALLGLGVALLFAPDGNKKKEEEK
jgi:ascorbate-specific PTS system EIIC-type component UlaA